MDTGRLTRHDRQREHGGEVLRLLLEARGFVSGQEICRRLGISRAAVWKQVEALRRQGVAVEGVSSHGYRLMGLPDVLRMLELNPVAGAAIIGRRVVVHEETVSTNDDARALATQGAPEGTVVAAEAQSRGRGRRGRN